MLRQACFKENFNGSALLFLLLVVQRSWDDYAEPLTYFDTLHVLGVIHRIFRTVIGVLFNPNQ
jgi:hypothetical protein